MGVELIRDAASVGHKEVITREALEIASLMVADAGSQSTLANQDRVQKATKYLLGLGQNLERKPRR